MSVGSIGGCGDLSYKSQIPVIEQAIDTAVLMLGTDKSRGYGLEMICADFPGWRALGQWRSQDLAQLDLTLLQVLAAYAEVSVPGHKSNAASNMDIYLTPPGPMGGGLIKVANSLLSQAIEQIAAGRRSAAVEAECEFVEVIRVFCSVLRPIAPLSSPPQNVSSTSTTPYPVIASIIAIPHGIWYC